jgi:hypothetical protein
LRPVSNRTHGPCSQQSVVRGTRQPCALQIHRSAASGGQAFNTPSSICGWYIISATGENGAEIPAAIVECDTRGFKKSAEEEAQFARVAAALKQQDDDELKKSATERTTSEVIRVLSRSHDRQMDAFRAHKVRPPARFSYGFTVSPDGTVKDVHKISSDFVNPALEQELLDLVRGSKFQARDVPEYVCPGMVFAYTE